MSRIFRGWGGSTTVFFAYTHWSHDLCPALIVPMMPFIKADLGLSYLQSGLLFSAFAITSGLSQFVGGWLGDRFSQRLVSSLGLGGVGIATMAIGLTAAYYPLLVALVVLGIIYGAYHPSAISMLSRYTDAENRGKVIGLYVTSGSLGFAIGPILGGVVAENMSWQLAFIILSIPTLIASPLAFRRFGQAQRAFIDKPVTSVADRNTGAQPSESAGLGQTLRSVAAILTLAALTQLITGSAVAFLPMYFIAKHKITATYAAIILGISRAGGLVGGPFGGWISDRWGRRKAIFLVFSLTGPALYLFTLLPMNASMVLWLVVFGLVWLMRQSTVQPYLLEATPSHLRATIFGIYFGVSMESMSLVQPVIGHFMDVFGIVEVLHFVAAMGVALSLVALFLTFKKTAVSSFTDY